MRFCNRKDAYGFFYGVATGEDWLNHEELTAGDHFLNALDVVPMEAAGKYAMLALFVKQGSRAMDIMPIIKRLNGYGVQYKCKEFCAAFSKKFSFLNAKKVELRSNKYKMVGGINKTDVFTDVGVHDVMEATIDGKSFIFDNMNGAMSKSEYIGQLEIMDPNTFERLYGQEAWDALGGK